LLQSIKYFCCQSCTNKGRDELNVSWNHIPSVGVKDLLEDAVQDKVPVAAGWAEKEPHAPAKSTFQPESYDFKPDPASAEWSASPAPKPPGSPAPAGALPAAAQLKVAAPAPRALAAPSAPVANGAGAGAPPEHALPSGEGSAPVQVVPKYMDPNDGTGPWSKEEFLQHYGEADGTALWNALKVEAEKASSKASPSRVPKASLKATLQTTPLSSEQAQRKVKQGDELFAKQMLEAAKARYTAAIMLEPANLRALVGRGGCNLRLDALDEAREDVEKALELDPQNLFALRDKAELCLRIGDYDGAIAAFDEKLKLAAVDGKALCGRGDAKLRKGDKEGAATDLSLAVKLGYPGAKDLLEKLKK